MNVTSNLLLASWSGFFTYLFIVLFIASAILLMGIVLIQKGRGGGLSSAFTGAMGSSPFGTKTGDVFTWITVVLAGLFLLGALVLNRLVKKEEAHTGTPGGDKPAAKASAAPAAAPRIEMPESTATPSPSASASPAPSAAPASRPTN